MAEIVSNPTSCCPVFTDCCVEPVPDRLNATVTYLSPCSCCPNDFVMERVAGQRWESTTEPCSGPSCGRLGLECRFPGGTWFVDGLCGAAINAVDCGPPFALEVLFYPRCCPLAIGVISITP